jgi:hypothetical protein
MALERSFPPDVALQVAFLSIGDVPGEESVTKLLAQLERRIKSDIELERWRRAVDEAVADLVRLGRAEALPRKPRNAGKPETTGIPESTHGAQAQVPPPMDGARRASVQ